MASTETRRKTVPAQVARLDQAFADLDREADEPDEADLEFPTDLKTADPMHRLMFLQMQQNSALLKKLTASKPQDPVLGALSGGGGLGGDNASASSSGVKGCSVAWQVDKKWQAFEPGSCRAVLPALVIRAAVALACLWGWDSWAGIVLLAFAAMLHPSEMLGLMRKDLIFPSDVCFDSPALFVKIRDPKTARFARRQHGRIDDPCIILITENLFGRFSPEQRLYGSTMPAFRKQWNAIMARLGIPFKQSEHGATPGVLRGSGATFLYTASEDVNWVAWRGRWSRVRTLEFYLQEVAAYVMIHSLAPFAKARVEFLSKYAWSVLWFRLNLAGSTAGMDEGNNMSKGKAPKAFSKGASVNKECGGL